MSLSTELLCTREIGRAIARKPTEYWPLLPSLYGTAAINPGIAAVLRHGYAFMRHLDDVIDGDLATEGAPQEYVSELREKMMRDPICVDPPILRTFAYVVLHWKHPTSPREYFSSLIDVLLFDHERTKRRMVLNAAELDAHYRRTFFPLIDFMFTAMGSQLRAEDVPVLTYGQAHWQCFRDLRQDWQEGRINIPAEVLEEAKLTAHHPAWEIASNPAIRTWFTEKLADTKDDFRQLGVMAQHHPEPLPRIALGFASWYFTHRIPDIQRK